MRRSLIIPCLLACLLSLNPQVHAGLEIAGRSFDRLDLRDGLSQNTVNAIHQDQRGFLWVATQDGLNRFDGFSFTVFKQVPGDSTSLANNFVSSICEDAEGTMWLGTFGGLSRFDRRHEIFESFLTDPGGSTEALNDPNVSAVVADPRGWLWIGTDGGGLQRLDIESRLFLPTPTVDGIAALEDGGSVLALALADDGRLWAGTKSGLYVVDPIASTVRKVGLALPPGTNREERSIRALAFGPNGRLWVGTGGVGLFCVEPSDLGFRHFRSNALDPRSLTGDQVQGIGVDRSGQIWIATRSGLNLYSEERADFTRIVRRSYPESLPESWINAVFADRSGVLWIGSETRGLFRHLDGPGRFPCLRFHNEDSNAAGSNILRAIHEGPNGTLWIGTDGGGLIQYDRQSGQARQFLHDPGDAESIAESSIRAIEMDDDGTLWLGHSDRGVSHFDPQTGIATRLRVDFDDPEALPHGAVRALALDEEHGLWIVADGGGVVRYDTNSDRLERFAHDPLDDRSLESDSVYTILRTRAGTIWVAGVGIDRFDPGTRRFERLRADLRTGAIERAFVLCLLESEDGDIWAGTESGLFRFGFDDGKTAYYGIQQGLPNDVVYGLLQDADGEIWGSTNDGLFRLSPESGKVVGYNVSQGLQSAEYNGGAYFESPSGELFFGGIDGLNAFFPSRIGSNENAPAIAITGLRIFNQSVHPGEIVGGRRILTQAISETQEIVVDHAQSVLTFEFAALHFVDPRGNRFAYRMAGFESDWNEVVGRRYATYTNLRPGSYRFELRAANPDGVWRPTVESMTVIVKPPLWMTDWFRGACILLFVAGMVAVIRWRTQSVATRNRDLETRVRERTESLEREILERRLAQEQSRQAQREAERANRAKSSFLATMSHEIRTPMNAVLGMTELLLDTELTHEQRDYGNNVYKGAEILLSVINEILDFSKIEAGRVELEVIAFDLRETVLKIQNLLSLRAQEKGLEFIVELADDLPANVYGDPTRLRQILINLLGNAIKFTSRGRVALRVQLVEHRGESDLIRFAVEDTGIGIPSDKIEDLFTPFAQAESSMNRRFGGTGLGLSISRQLAELMGGRIGVESTLGSGSVFDVTLPMRHASGHALSVDSTPTVDAKHEPSSVQRGETRILVVEDNAVNLRLVARILEKEGFQHRTAENGEEALEILRRESIDLVLMDVQMPVLDGLEATRIIRSAVDPALDASMPVIALTANAIDGDRDVCLAAGMNDYIAKPIRRESMIATIEKCLARDRRPSPEGVG